MTSGTQRAAKAIAKAPVHVYRWTLKPLIGWECRHLPSCSEYALEAIDRNGAWRGSWLALSRVCRCHPWGSQGLDPVPDITKARQHLCWEPRYSLRDALTYTVQHYVGAGSP